MKKDPEFIQFATLFEDPESLRFLCTRRNFDQLTSYRFLLEYPSAASLKDEERMRRTQRRCLRRRSRRRRRRGAGCPYLRYRHAVARPTTRKGRSTPRKRQEGTKPVHLSILLSPISLCSFLTCTLALLLSPVWKVVYQSSTEYR